MCTIGVGDELLVSIRERNFSKTRLILARDDVIDFIDEQEPQGWTALMIAAQYNDVETIQTLIKRRANTAIQNKVGQTAQDVALLYKSRAAFNVLKTQKRMASVEYPLINYFSHVPLNRQADKRKDSTWLGNMRSDPATKYVIFSNLKPLAAKLPGEKKYNLSILNYAQINNILGEDTSNIDNVVFLGTQESFPKEYPDSRETSKELNATKDSCAWFAVDVGQINQASEKFLRDCPGAEYLSSRPGFLQVHFEDATILAQARPILEWHQNNRFCPRCGNTVKMDEGGYKQTCTNSQCSSNKGILNVSYPRLDPVSIMLVISQDGTQCLLGRKPVFPKGMYSCLAGYMEPGETIEDAVRREVLEESGIQVDLVEYHSSQFWPYPSQLMIGCLAHATTETIIVDKDELEDAKWFTLDNVRQACNVITGPRNPVALWFPPRQAIARQLIEHWVEMGSSHL